MKNNRPNKKKGIESHDIIVKREAEKKDSINKKTQIKKELNTNVLFLLIIDNNCQRCVKEHVALCVTNKAKINK